MKMLKSFCGALLILVLAVPAFAAESYGRAVAYDKDNKKITIIEDKLGWTNPARPEFTVLPAKEFILPEDPGPMSPKVGGRLRIDLEIKEIIIYNPVAKTIDAFAVEIVDRKDNIAPDDDMVKGKTFPVAKKETSEVTIYSPRQKNVSTIKVPAKYMEMNLPPHVWDNADDVKITYNDPGKATGFVNITKSK
jgi:hypothetical protein